MKGNKFHMQNNECYRVIFMGTPEFSISALNMLVAEQYNVVAVVTQPDRPVGRKRVLTPPPVKEAALQHNIPVLQPEKIQEALAELKALAPDIIITAAYGQILPPSILNLPRHGCINIHASLLPRYRGGAPIQYAIMNGDEVTGVTIMYMAEGLDSGDIISQVEVPIAHEDDVGTMFHKLSIAGAELLKTTLSPLLAGQLQAQPQDERLATYAPNIRRKDEMIDWHKSALQIYNHVRALHPWPISYTLWNGERLKIWQCQLPSERHESRLDAFVDAVPGTVLQATAEGIEVKTGDGCIWLTKIQPAGKRAMAVAQFIQGSDMPAGTVLGGEQA